MIVALLIAMACPALPSNLKPLIAFGTRSSYAPAGEPVRLRFALFEDGTVLWARGNDYRSAVFLWCAKLKDEDARALIESLRRPAISDFAGVFEYHDTPERSLHRIRLQGNRGIETVDIRGRLSPTLLKKLADPIREALTIMLSFEDQNANYWTPAAFKIKAKRDSAGGSAPGCTWPAEWQEPTKKTREMVVPDASWDEFREIVLKCKSSVKRATQAFALSYDVEVPAQSFLQDPPK